MHSFKTHFSSPCFSYINAPTAHVFNTTEGWTVCFHSCLFLKPVWHPWVPTFKWPLNGWHLNGPTFPWRAASQLWITTRLADELCHGFRCFLWHVEVKVAPMEVIFLFLVKTYPLPATSWVTTHTSYSSLSASGIRYANKKYLEWREIQLAIQFTVDTLNS